MPSPLPDLPSFGHTLRVHARENPGRVLLRFLPDGGGGPRDVTNAELDRRCRAVAARMQTRGAAGERALILVPPGIDYVVAFFGALYAGAAAVPSYPPGLGGLERSLGRIDRIVASCTPRFLLASEPILAARDALVAQSPRLGGLDWIAVDALEPGVEHLFAEPPLDPGHLALLQYTSGSTGAPKGVMVSHGNLLHNTAEISHRADAEPDDVQVCWLPPYHDMGLIGGILWPFRRGNRTVLMTPLAFLKQPYRWVKTVSDERASISGAPNFAWELVAAKVTPEQRDGLDLSCLRFACTSAEPIRPQTLDRFTEAFAPVGFERRSFFPCYGLAETTLICTGGWRSRPPVVRVYDTRAFDAGRVVPAAERAGGPAGTARVGSGTATEGMDVIVVDPETRRLVAGRTPGEIWVSGPSVALGYWGLRAETAEAFGAVLADRDEARRHPGPFLRTGDLGFLEDGELFVTGRIKDLVIVHGRNYHAEDLEAAIAGAHPALRKGGCAVFSIEAGPEAAVVVHEVESRGLDAAAVVRAIRRAVRDEHELELHAVVLIRARTLQKTPSGKVQRRATRDAFLRGALAGEIHVWRHPRALARPRRSAAAGAAP